MPNSVNFRIELRMVLLEQVGFHKRFQKYPPESQPSTSHFFFLTDHAFLASVSRVAGNVCMLTVVAWCAPQCRAESLLPFTVIWRCFI